MPAEPLGDAPSPQCGTLLWPLGGFADVFLFPGRALSADNRDYLAEFCRRLGALPADSLDRVETLLELAARFDLSIPDEMAEGCTSIDDLLHWLRDRLDE